jgi:hypothetical protein
MEPNGNNISAAKSTIWNIMPTRERKDKDIMPPLIYFELLISAPLFIMSQDNKIS